LKFEQKPFAIHLHILGLELCADTVAGNPMLRAIYATLSKCVATG